MKLSLVVQNMDTLDNGLPARLDLEERGAIIGRSPTVTWCLPDPTNHVSSRHCEIVFREGQFVLNDTSTNGTFINGRQVTAPSPLESGSVLSIGPYLITVIVVGQASAASAHTAQAPSGWGPWDSQGAPPAPPASDDWGPAAPVGSSPGWDPAPAAPAATETDVWGVAPQTAPAPPPQATSPAGAWAAVPPPPVQEASPWSSAVVDAVAAPTPKGDDIWGKIADDYVVDWARGGFGQARPPEPTASHMLGFGGGPATEGVATDVLGLAADNRGAASAVPAPSVAGVNFTPSAPWGSPPSPPDPQPQAPAPSGWDALAAPAPQPSPQPQPQPQPIVAAPAPASAGLGGFASRLGVTRGDLKGSDAEVLDASGMLLHKVIAGLVVMLEARARAKSQMGAQGTALQFDGNNPMKFARTPEQAITQLLNPPERGFMTAERAVEDAFTDLNSHQIATLKAMQGALKATLDRFSPASIRQRAESGGLMAKIFPDARDAALWKAYEREFSGVVQGSDEAFMDVFSKEFRKAYEELTARKTF